MLARSTFLVAILTGLAFAREAGATELVVQVEGIRSDRGEIGCALFDGERGFPMDGAAARIVWQPALRTGTACRFSGLASGRYALAVSHDLNGNRKTDTNFLGMPTEDWGVSGGARPSLRAPRFSEAAFELPADGATRVVVTVAP